MGAFSRKSDQLGGIQDSVGLGESQKQEMSHYELVSSSYTKVKLILLGF